MSGPEMMVRALELRAAGKTYAEISATLGIGLEEAVELVDSALFQARNATPLERAVQRRAELQALAAELLALDARAKTLKNELVAGMAAAGVRRLDVTGVGAVSFVAGGPGSRTDANALEKKLGLMAGTLRELGCALNSAMDESIPLILYTRAASVRCSHKAGVGLEVKDEEDLG